MTTDTDTETFADEGLVWEEPPARVARGRSVGKYDDTFKLLRDNPGRWARIAVLKQRSLADQIKGGKVLGAKPGEFDAAARQVAVHGEEKPEFHIYARFVPEDERTEPAVESDEDGRTAPNEG